MMLRQYLVTAALFLFLVSNASLVFANNEETARAVHQTIESYCKIEFDGAWVPDRWAIIKFSSKRKAERKFSEIMDSAVFQLEHYPFIVVTSYDIRDVHLLNPVRATALVAYSRVAHSERKPIRGWHLATDHKDNDLVNLNLVFEKNKWYVLDPPPPRISKQMLVEYYEAKIKRLQDNGWLTQPSLSTNQKATFDNDIENLRILKSLP